MKAKVARWLEKTAALSCACKRKATPSVHCTGSRVCSAWSIWAAFALRVSCSCLKKSLSFLRSLSFCVDSV